MSRVIVPDGEAGPEVRRLTSPPTSSHLRQRAFGQDDRLTPVDRLGIWLSARRVRGSAGNFSGRRFADIGCGYHATFACTLLDEVEHLLLLDVAVAPWLKNDPRITAIEGLLPDALEGIEDESLDIVLCNSVLEHLWQPRNVLRKIYRALSASGVLMVNVPTWRGKRFLELSAFRFGLSPAAEMDDHKMYYDPRDLWPLLVSAGFRPRDIRCFRHKFGLNTFATCRKRSGSEEPARPHLVPRREAVPASKDRRGASYERAGQARR